MNFRINSLIGRRYLKTHEWAIHLDSNLLVVGVTERHQCLLGDAWFIDSVIDKYDKTYLGNTIAIIDSVKVSSRVISPVTGTFIDFNKQLYSNPDYVNFAPLTIGWIATIAFDNLIEFENMMDEKQYVEYISNMSKE